MSKSKTISRCFPNISLWLQDETGAFIAELGSCTLERRAEKGSFSEHQTCTITFTSYSDFRSNFNTKYFIKLLWEKYSCISFELDPSITYEKDVQHKVVGETSVWFEDFSIYETGVEGFKVKSALYNLKDNLILNLESDSSNPPENSSLELKLRKVDDKPVNLGFNPRLNIPHINFKYNRFL